MFSCGVENRALENTMYCSLLDATTRGSIEHLTHLCLGERHTLNVETLLEVITLCFTVSQSPPTFVHTGSMPPELGDLGALQHLDFSENMLIGEHEHAGSQLPGRKRENIKYQQPGVPTPASIITYNDAAVREHSNHPAYKICYSGLSSPSSILRTERFVCLALSPQAPSRRSWDTSRI